MNTIDDKLNYLIENSGQSETEYTYENPRIQASGRLSASNITWVGGFNVDICINLKPKDNNICFITTRDMTINIDGESHSHAVGTSTYKLNNNNTFTASLGGPTKGDQSCNYEYIIW